jgi:hypothetical protein
MSGNIFAKEASAVVLQNDNGSSLSNGNGTSISTTLDNRSSGNGAQNFFGNFELKTAGFGSAPSAHQPLDLYLVPTLDGTNAADVTSSIPEATYYVGSFLTLNSSSAKRFCLLNIPLQPLLYTVYLVNNTGQTLSANWGLRVVTSQDQYT